MRTLILVVLVTASVLAVAATVAHPDLSVLTLAAVCLVGAVVAALIAAARSIGWATTPRRNRSPRRL